MHGDGKGFVYETDTLSSTLLKNLDTNKFTFRFAGVQAFSPRVLKTFADFIRTLVGPSSIMSATTRHACGGGATFGALKLGFLAR